MREIKFRAYDKFHKQIMNVLEIDFNTSEVVLSESNETIDAYWLQFEDCILMQYTGLKDKNRTEIYEGDIVDCEKRGYAFYKSVVKYNDVMGRFDIVQGVGSFPLTQEEIVDDISIGGLDYEVIGNIYENPELLEWRE